MNAVTVYRMALRLLPSELRRKHGADMEALFARDLERAAARGGLHRTLAITSGLWDVVSRAAYEQVRTAHGAPVEQHVSRAQLLRRHAYAFSIAFVALTSAFLFLFSRNQWPTLAARGATIGTVVEVLLMGLPFTAALTIPMAVLFAVLQVFTRLGANGTLSAARRERGGVRRLVVPVLAAATGVAALALVVTAEIVPRANERLATVLSGRIGVPSDRTLTIPQLQTAVRNVAVASEPVARERVASLEVEIQKKLALPAACIVLAIAGMAIAFRFPRGGTWLVIGATLMVVFGYYTLMMTGETLADRLVVSPSVGMWGANGVMLLAAMLLAWRRAESGSPPTVA